MNILNTLTIKHLLMNKKRTLVTIIGVILSTALMVGIGLLFSSVRDNMLKMIIQENGNHHVIFENIDNDKIDIIKNNVSVKNVSYITNITSSKPVNIEIENSYKPYIYLIGIDKGFQDKLVLIDGRLAQNENEIVISNHINDNLGVNIKVGDEITVDLGKRYDPNEGEIIGNDSYSENETFEVTLRKTYKVVGIVERNFVEDYSSAGYSAFTIIPADSNKVDVYVEYKNVKNTYDISKAIANTIGLKSSDNSQLKYNNNLLYMHGISKYDNYNSSLAFVIIIVLSLISIGCIVVIYNSFAISVMERKKQFGLFASIGTTKNQIRKTVFFEAFIIGIIGIPFGILSSMLGIHVLLEVVNYLIPDVFPFPLVLSIYPLFIIIPIIFMIIVIILSAFIPAFKASKVTPIQAIRQNDDIKIKSKKIKTNKLIKKIFGIEGEIALKNIKRNKRKYRITIISLVVSIVLFISFSTFLYYGFNTTDEVTTLVDYDISVFANDNDLEEIDKVFDNIINNEQVEDYTILSSYYYSTTSISKDNFNNRINELLDIEDISDHTIISIYALDNESYNKFIKKANLSGEKPIIINKFKGSIYEDNKRLTLNIKQFNSLPSKIELCNIFYDGEEQEEKCDISIDNYEITDIIPFAFSGNLNPAGLTIIINEDMKKIYDNTFEVSDKFLYIKASKYDSLMKQLETIEKENNLEVFNYFNVIEEMKLVKNIILVTKILLYGFITLITLIGVTSVFNTINTNINLRRKEFAMLRSMGLTPKGFNKLLYFESIFFGIKSLLYGIPLSIGVTLLFHLAFDSIVEIENIYIPYTSIIIAIVGVFVIVFITMIYASSKVKHENILDVIREENI